ncbi:DUF2793 domain-containing protein [Roseibium sp.]|uniref:DUF2793 domain-containing protein n=1 Tax=Roseibium sp. TaxID=1936156 RepID=UPI003B52D274
MSETSRLALPLLAAAQAQKHVTHNESLLRMDALSHPAVKSRTLTVPPVATEGDLYLVAASATAEWAGRDGQIAEWRNGVWEFYAPFEGLAVHVTVEGIGLKYLSGAWQEMDGVFSDTRLLARGSFGAQSEHRVIEAELTALSGTYVETAAIIPDRAIVFCVSTRTIATVTGATSYDCGLAGEQSKFGGSLGAAAGSSNLGVIGPTAFYSDTAVRLTANGGSFSGGTVRLAVHCFVPVAPSA